MTKVKYNTKVLINFQSEKNFFWKSESLYLTKTIYKHS